MKISIFRQHFHLWTKFQLLDIIYTGHYCFSEFIVLDYQWNLLGDCKFTIFAKLQIVKRKES